LELSNILAGGAESGVMKFMMSIMTLMKNIMSITRVMKIMKTSEFFHGTRALKATAVWGYKKGAPVIEAKLSLTLT